ncbi:hypothetical protein LCGC14_0245710 [marine sediment metagenome]|uniref:Uncharacterized protein n=1 Tax=marine sediment metagenome TaxID=412755 RepID=A0A0F9U643_9ZZZZ
MAKVTSVDTIPTSRGVQIIINYEPTKDKEGNRIEYAPSFYPDTKVMQEFWADAVGKEVKRNAR